MVANGCWASASRASASGLGSRWIGAPRTNRALPSASRRSASSELTGCAAAAMGTSVAERDAERARGEHAFAVERHALHASGRLLQRHVVDARRVDGDHDPVLALGERADGGGAEGETEHAIDRDRRAAA